MKKNKLFQKWEDIEFLDVLEKEASNNKLKIPQKDFLKEGELPIIDQGDNFIAGYTNDLSKSYLDKLPVVVFGDHTRALKFIDFKFAMGADGIKILVPKRDIDVKYFYYCLKNKNIPSSGYSRHYKFLKELKIPLPFTFEGKPDLKKQKQIAKILEDAEKLKDKNKVTIEALDEYLKSVFSEMFGHPIYNQKKWNIAELKDLGDWKSGGTPSRINKEYFKGDIPWYTTGELNKLYIGDSKEKITEKAIRKSGAKILGKNMLLLGMYDTAALKSSITTVRASCNQAVVFSKLESGNSNIMYVYYAIQMGKKHYLSQQRGVRQKNLNLSIVKSLKIPLPPFPLQEKFAKIVEQVEKTKEKLKQNEKALEELFDSLMQRAFRGELV